MVEKLDLPWSVDPEEPDDASVMPSTLPPPDATVVLVPTPPLDGVMAGIGSRVQQLLEISTEQWPDDREVCLEVDIALVPTSVRVIVRKR